MTKKEQTLQEMVNEMVKLALAAQDETAMVKVPRKQAFNKIAGLWKILNKHFVKIALWGDSPMWRKEIISFAENIADVRLKLKSRPSLTREEHLDAMTDYRNTSIGRNQFTRTYYSIQSEMTSKPVRSLEEGRKIVYELQMTFLDNFIMNKPEDPNKLIDSVLDKYPKIEY